LSTDTAIASTLAFLHELFPGRDIGPATLDAWSIYFSDWSDDELRVHAMAAAREPGRKFFPTPGEIAAHRELPTIDTDALLSRLAKLGHHNPVTGWQHPTSLAVRDAFGDAVSTAYIDAGTSRCFASDDPNGGSITRDIARRAFAEAIKTAHQRTPGGLKLPPPKREPAMVPEEPRERMLLTAGDPAHQSVSSSPAGGQNWKSQVPAPSFPTSLRGRVAVGREYRLARAKAVQDWADAGNADAYAKIAKRVEADLELKETMTGLPVSPAGRQDAINTAVAPYLPFPEFAEWVKQQGYVLVDGPLPEEPKPKREHKLEPLRSDADSPPLEEPHDMDDVIEQAIEPGVTP
jgi:hypothetical protein